MNALRKCRAFAQIIVLFALLLMGAAEAQATHFRFGHLSWQPRPDVSPTTVDFTLMGAFRRSYYLGSGPDGGPKVGDLVVESATQLYFGDGTSIANIYFEVTAISVEQDWVLGVARQAGGPSGLIRKTYAKPLQADGQPWVPNVSGCCRIDALRNSTSSQIVQSRVDLTLSNTPPVSNLPPIVSCQRATTCRFAVPAVDANGDKVRWRFTPANQSGIDSLPGGTPAGQPISIDPDTGVITWTTTAGAALGLYALSVTMEDLSPDGQVKSSSAIDFLLNLQSTADNAPPVFVPPTPASNSIFEVMADRPVSIELRASDPNLADLVTLNHVGLPQGASFTATQSNPAAGLFEWTPRAADVGDRIVTFTAIDSRGGAALPHPLVLRVTNPPIRNLKVTAAVANSGIDIQHASHATAPTRIEQQADHTIVEWEFEGFATGENATLDFDVLLENPKAGEQRLVTERIELSYQDINGVQVRQTLPSQFVNVLPSIFQVGVSTDQPAYGPDRIVSIAAPISNLSDAPAAAAIRISVHDVNGVQVRELALLPEIVVAPGETRQLSGFQFLTGDTYAGSYLAVAEILDTHGKTIVKASAPFQVLADAEVAARASIAADKQVYQPSEVAHIDGRLTNATRNLMLSDLRVTTTVTNPDGSIRFSNTDVLPQLAQGALQDYRYQLPLAFAPAGTYAATLTVAQADGTELARSSTRFRVLSTSDSGSGLAATISAAPKEVPPGEAVAVSFTAFNAGNGVLGDLPLRVRIVDPEEQTVLAEFPYQANLDIGAKYAAAVSWKTVGTVGATYVAILSATVAGGELTLAQDSFKLIAAPVKLDVQQSASNASRVLALISCNDGVLITAANSDSKTPCVTDRSQAIEQVLTGLGVPHTVVTDEDAFRHALRSGIYNTYWISGKADKLRGDLSSEVRETIFGGDGFLSDSMHDQRNKVLDEAAGITYRGKIGPTGLDVDITGPLFATQRLRTAERGLRLQPNGSNPQASFVNKKGEIAILDHTYGSGRALTFAFDLARSLRSEPGWKAILAASLQYVAPDSPAIFTPGALLSVRTRVANLAKAVDVTATATLPQGAAYIGSSPTGAYDPRQGTVAWALALAEEQEKNLFLTLRTPARAGDYLLRTEVATTRNGATSAYGGPLSFAFTVVPASETAGKAVQKLAGLVLAQAKERKQRDRLIADLQQAMALFEQGSAGGYESVIGRLIGIVDGLAGIASADTSAVRRDLGLILREAQWRWTKGQ